MSVEVMSVIEVERKRELRGTCAAVEARLNESGYREDGSFVEVDTHYSRSSDYVETVECLQARRRDDFAEITYKPASDASTQPRRRHLQARDERYPEQRRPSRGRQPPANGHRHDPPGADREVASPVPPS